jgi:hypothetical protein
MAKRTETTPDITRIPAVDDAPSIAAPEVSAAIPEAVAAVAASEAPAVVPPAAAPTIEAPGGEAPSLPRAAQLAAPEAAASAAPEHAAKPDPRRAGDIAASPRAPSQLGRFTLLAAALAFAACLGAIGGSLGIAGYERAMLARAPAPPAPPPVQTAAAPDPSAEEIKLLKETIAQLRANTKALNDGLNALRTGLANTSAASAAQMSKIAETLDRVERRAIVAQAPPLAPQAAAPAPPAPETTGSILPRPAAPAPAANEPAKPPIIAGWVLRKVYDGAALIEGREGIIEVEPGAVLPGAGRVESIKRQDGRWVVVTTRGLILPR